MGVETILDSTTSARHRGRSQSASADAADAPNKKPLLPVVANNNANKPHTMVPTIRGK
jgi:hypothetical protein